MHLVKMRACAYFQRGSAMRQSLSFISLFIQFSSALSPPPVLASSGLMSRGGAVRYKSACAAPTASSSKRLSMAPGSSPPVSSVSSAWSTTESVQRAAPQQKMQVVNT